MVLIVNYSKNKINLILPASSIAAIVLRAPAACRRFSPDQGDRRLAAKLGIVLIILSTINQPFSESCGFDESKRIILDLFLADVCFIDQFFLHGAFPDGQSCFFACRNGFLILIYRHRVKSVCKSLNSHGELSIC